jgi:hypothetical protein
VFSTPNPPDLARAYPPQDFERKHTIREVSVMTRTRNRLLLGGGLVSAAVLAATGALAQAARFDTHDNDKHGFSLTYPTGTFVALPLSTPDGFQAVSRDGNARLLAGTISNFDGKSLADYRTFLLNAAYPGAKIDYAPVRKTWFVVSGVRKDGITAFYQRVNFVCGGRNINSWAVIFPYGQEPVYSKIIDQIHRDYAVGDGNCDRTATMAPPAMPPRQMGAQPGDKAPAMAKMGDMERIMSGAMEPSMPPKEMVAMMPKDMAPPKDNAPMAMQPPAMQPPAMQPKDTPAMAPATPPRQMAAIAPQMPPKAMAGMAMEPGLVTYDNDKHGFSLTYPKAQFLALPPASPDVFQAVSKDGKARLQASTVANFDGKSLGGYRSFLLAASYPDAKLGDAPMLGKGFTLSGVKSDGTTAFYHRVGFTCGWGKINSWSLLYPVAEQATYARIVEQVDRDYMPGDGNCGTMGGMPAK